MTPPTALSVRDRRIVLALAGAAAVWRWFVAMRTPLPGVDACRSLLLAEDFARFDFARFGEAPTEALWAMVLAPLVALGVTPWFAAQVVACALGGGVVVLAAIAAERWRESAGVPAAVLAMVAAGAAVAAGAGAGSALQGALAAAAAWALAARRWSWCAIACALAVLPGPDALVENAVSSFDRVVRLGGVYLLPAAAMWALPPRPARAIYLAGALLAAFVFAAVGPGLPALGPALSPWLAVLGGIGLARLPARGRELVVCGIVLVEMHGAWREIEPPTAVAERIVGCLLRSHVVAGERIVSDRPRVLWAAGQWPEPTRSPDAVLVAAARPQTAFLVLDRQVAKDATVAASLAGTFARHEISADLVDLLTERGLQVLVRRRRP